MNKLMELQDKIALRKATKKGAASIETIIVSGLLIALAVGIILGFNSTIQKNASDSSTSIDKTVTDMNAGLAADAVEK